MTDLLSTLPPASEFASEYDKKPSFDTLAKILDNHFSVLLDFADSAPLTIEGRTLSEENQKFLQLLDGVEKRWREFVSLVDITQGSFGQLGQMIKSGISLMYPTTEAEQVLRWMAEYMFENFIRDVHPETYRVWKPRQIVRMMGYQGQFSSPTSLNIPALDADEIKRRSDELDLVDALLMTLANRED